MQLEGTYKTSNSLPLPVNCHIHAKRKMDTSTAFDILCLLAIIYLYPTRPQYAQQEPMTRGLTTPSTPVTPARSTNHLIVPDIVLSSSDNVAQQQQPHFKISAHKRKAVSFSLSSMDALGDGNQDKTSPMAHHRPPTPYRRAPPTPSEILAMSSTPSTPQFSARSSPKLQVSKENTDQMGIKKVWLI